MIPQPKPHFLLGNIKDIEPATIVNSMVKIAANYEGIFKLNLPGREVVVAYSQELVNELSDESRFDKQLTRPLEILRGLIGDGLFTAHTHESNWGKAHRLLMPAFGVMAIRDMFPQMLDIAEQLMLKLERYGDKHAFNVSDEMTRLTLDTIALCAFDYRFNSFYTDSMHPFVEAMMRSLTESGKMGIRLPIQQKLMFSAQQKYKQDNDYLGNIADEVIAERKANPNQKNDLLNIMLNSTDPVTGEKLSDENIRYQLITFLIAGHETTSGLLAFTTHLLLKNPKVLEKLRQEIDTVLGNETPRIEHLPKLKYLEKVLKESLRLHPTASAFSVSPFEDTVIGGTYPIAKNQAVVILPWMLHRDKKVWGDDVEAFKPERFDAEHFSSLPPNSWKPFGNGQRACIGMSFAMQEAILVMAMLLQRFDLSENDPNYTLKIKETLTIKPDNFYIKVKKREGFTETKGVITAASLTPQKATPIAKNTEGVTPLLILYGSNGGSSESFAQRLAKTSQQAGFTVTIGELDKYVNQLPKTGAVLIITASYEGQPTYNARQFVHWLEALRGNDLKGVKYAVLGCGHTDWVKTYQVVPTKIDDLLGANGAERLMARGEANAAGDFLGDFDAWQDAIITQLIESFDKKTATTPNDALLSIEITSNRTSYLQQTGLESCHIVENRELVNMQDPHARSKRHIEIALPESMTYQAGDYVAVLPCNPKNAVDRVLKRFQLQSDTHVIIHKNKDLTWHFPTDYPVSIVDILTNYVELAQPATKKQLIILTENCPCPPEKMALQRLTDTATYQTDVLNKRLSVLDLLEKFASVSLPLAAFLEMLPPLKPRLYSISSSPLWQERQVSLTVAVVKAAAWSGRGQFEGIASNYLATLPTGSPLTIMTRPAATAFHLPQQTEQPIIMVCAGTGLAPFRGFIQERAIQKEQGMSVGKSLLFFGCDHPEVDYLYKDELANWEKQGAVTVHTAFSRASDNDIVFVQHRLWHERRKVWQLLQDNAKIYVCGDGKYMAPAIKETFINIYRDSTQCSAQEAEIWINDLQKDSVRYVADVFI